MAEHSSAMDVDEKETSPILRPAPSFSSHAEAPHRPASRKPTSFSLDLQMPLRVYFPTDDDKWIVRFQARLAPFNGAFA